MEAFILEKTDGGWVRLVMREGGGPGVGADRVLCTIKSREGVRWAEWCVENLGKDAVPLNKGMTRIFLPPEEAMLMAIVVAAVGATANFATYSGRCRSRIPREAVLYWFTQIYWGRSKTSQAAWKRALKTILNSKE